MEIGRCGKYFLGRSSQLLFVRVTTSIKCQESTNWRLQRKKAKHVLPPKRVGRVLISCEAKSCKKFVDLSSPISGHFRIRREDGPVTPVTPLCWSVHMVKTKPCGAPTKPRRPSQKLILFRIRRVYSILPLRLIYTNKSDHSRVPYALKENCGPQPIQCLREPAGLKTY